MGQVRQKAKVSALSPHICRKGSPIGSRSHEHRLVHIMIKQLQLHLESLFLRVTADLDRGL